MAKTDETKDTEEQGAEVIQCLYSGEMKVAEDGGFYIDIPIEIFLQKDE